MTVLTASAKPTPVIKAIAIETLRSTRPGNSGFTGRPAARIPVVTAHITKLR
ncbi:MAG: hypothetical protein ACYSWU_24165 [Planctomycetota bacterium]